MTTETSTSGFTDDINTLSADLTMVSHTFTNVEECYVSRSGHARLLSASRFGKRYMLKCLKPDFLSILTYRLALNKEFEIGIQLDHHNICHTISMELLPDLGPTIVMEYIDGETLESFMSNGRMTKALGRKFVAQLTDALSYMHLKQVLHRDLKPTNVMVTHHGQNIRLIDFSLSDSDSFSVFKSPGGTSGYIAPELFLPNPHCDARCDIYSLGVLMACIAEKNGDRGMMKTAARCMSHDPSKRPASMSEVVISSDVTPSELIAVIVLTLLSILQLLFILFSLSD